MNHTTRAQQQIERHTPEREPRAPQRVAGQILGVLEEAGVEVLFDDRPERPGVKFKDMDLVGFPVRVVVGQRGLSNGEVELSLRRDGEKILVPVENAIEKIKELLAG